MAIVPGHKIHYENQKSWLRFMAKYETELRSTNIAGYILTGWSRYDHFAAMCELLPVSIPSLVVNSLVATQTADIAKNYAKILKCTVANALQDFTNVQSVTKCDFPGKDLFSRMLELIDYQNETNFLYDKLYENNAWMTIFHLKRRSTNVSKIRRLIEKYKFTEFKKKFSNFRDELKLTMGKYYENETIAEWFEERVELYANKIQFLDECFTKLIH